jgi:hypothetical protein
LCSPLKIKALYRRISVSLHALTLAPSLQRSPFQSPSIFAWFIYGSKVSNRRIRNNDKSGNNGKLWGSLFKALFMQLLRETEKNVSLGSNSNNGLPKYGGAKPMLTRIRQ